MYFVFWSFLQICQVSDKWVKYNCFPLFSVAEVDVLWDLISHSLIWIHNIYVYCTGFILHLYALVPYASNTVILSFFRYLWWEYMYMKYLDFLGTVTMEAIYVYTVEWQTATLCKVTVKMTFLCLEFLFSISGRLEDTVSSQSSKGSI